MINKLNFELISLDKQELYHKYFSATPTQSADYTFMNIFGLKDIYMLEWAFTDDFVFIRQKYPQIMYWAPIGDWNNKSDILSDYLKDINNIIRIPKDLALYLESNNIKDGVYIKNDYVEFEEIELFEKSMNILFPKSFRYRR